jgi:hypothetical protein
MPSAFSFYNRKYNTYKQQYYAHTYVIRIQIPPDHHSFRSTRNGFHYRIPDYHGSGTTRSYKKDRRLPIGIEKYSQPARTIIITYERHCFPFPQSLAMLCTYVANHCTQPTVLITSPFQCAYACTSRTNFAIEQTNKVGRMND